MLAVGLGMDGDVSGGLVVRPDGIIAVKLLAAGSEGLTRLNPLILLWVQALRSSTVLSSSFTSLISSSSITTVSLLSESATATGKVYHSYY